MADDTDDLPDLDPELGALLSAYEAETARDAAQVDAALARVTASAGTAGSGGAAALSTSTKLGLVGGLVGIVGVVGLVAFGPSNEPASAPPITTQTAITSAEPTAPTIVVETPDEASVVAPPLAATTGGAISVVDEAPHMPGERRTRPVGSSRPPRSTEPPPAASTLKAELELLQRARGALRRGRADEALEIVRQHRREYPSSAITEERDATEVSALCALGRLDAGACR
jgi:hypothetical protein